MKKNNTSWEKDDTSWVREIEKETYVSAIGTISFRTVASAYVSMENVKVIKLVAQSGLTADKETEDLIENYGVKKIKGKSSDFIINYKLEKDENIDDINPFNTTALSDILKTMDEKLPRFYNKKTRQSNPCDLPISLLEIEVTDPKFVDIAKLENKNYSKVDIQFISQKAENKDLKDDIYKYHRDHNLEYLFEHGFKKYTLNCCLVMDTHKRYSKEKDVDYALIRWGGIDDLFPKTNPYLWEYIHSHYILPQDFRVRKRVVVYPDDKSALDGYTWG